MLSKCYGPVGEQSNVAGIVYYMDLTSKSKDYVNQFGAHLRVYDASASTVTDDGAFRSFKDGHLQRRRGVLEVFADGLH